MKTVNLGNGIVFAFGGAGAGFFISVFIGLVLLFVDYSEFRVDLVRLSNWVMPIVGAVVGGVFGLISREETRF